MKRPHTEVAPAARRDLNDHARWLRREAGPDVAARYARAATDTFRLIAANPGIGTPVRDEADDAEHIRKWRIAGFPRLLIFYLPIDDGIRIVRVLHAARDWPELLTP